MMFWTVLLEHFLISYLYFVHSVKKRFLSLVSSCLSSYRSVNLPVCLLRLSLPLALFCLSLPHFFRAEILKVSHPTDVITSKDMFFFLNISFLLLYFSLLSVSLSLFFLFIQPGCLVAQTLIHHRLLKSPLRKPVWR